MPISPEHYPPPVMSPQQLGQAYDRIAPWWWRQMRDSRIGFPFLYRALDLCKGRGRALDAGCGAGRMLPALCEAGFASVTGIDVSREMLELARENCAQAELVLCDTCEFHPLEGYDFIVAWDSTFHLPLALQRAGHEGLCALLKPGGVVLFTAGGICGEAGGVMEGIRFYHSSLAQEEYLRILHGAGCRCLLLERDQYPQEHVVIMGIRE